MQGETEPNIFDEKKDTGCFFTLGLPLKVLSTENLRQRRLT